EPGVARIDYATDNTGLQTGDIGQFGYTDDLSPVIGGYQAEATGDLVIRIVCNAEFIGTALIGPDGHWSFTPPTPLEPNHEYIFTTIIQDSATDALLVSLPYRFYTTDVNGDLKPDVSIDKVTDAVKGANNATGALHHGDVTNDARPALSGHATANARVNIYDNGELIGSTTASSKGAWTYNPGTLSNGDHYLSASVYTAAGESHRSASFGITVDTHAETPVITEVYDDKGLHTGPVALGGATDDSQPKVSGTAEAGSTVTVMVHSATLNHTYTLGSVVADAHGRWSYQLHGSQNINATKGDWTFLAQSVDVAGNQSPMSSGYIVEAVASNADVSATPEITYIVDDVGLHTGNIADGGKTDDTEPRLHGTGEPYSTVVITMDGPVSHSTYTIATLTVGKDGTWDYQFKGGQKLQSGNNVFHITATDGDGHKVTGHTYTVDLVGSNQDTDGPDVPTIDKYHDNAGASSGDFKSGTTTDDTTPTLYGHADAKSVVKIYEGSTLLGSVTADKDGEWNFTPSERSEGKHTFFATATDAAGHTSGHSGNFVVTIDVPDTTPPDAPVIT
ncbi:Ig-like domain-containing protein, partial [Rahnella woolbedingensis]